MLVPTDVRAFCGAPLPYIPWSELHDSLHDHASLEFGYSTRGEGDDDSLAAQFGHDERFGGRLKPFAEYLTSIVERGEQARRRAAVGEPIVAADRRPRTGRSPPPTNPGRRSGRP